MSPACDWSSWQAMGKTNVLKSSLLSYQYFHYALVENACVSADYSWAVFVVNLFVYLHSHRKVVCPRNLSLQEAKDWPNNSSVLSMQFALLQYRSIYTHIRVLPIQTQRLQIPDTWHLTVYPWSVSKVRLFPSNAWQAWMCPTWKGAKHCNVGGERVFIGYYLCHI